MNFQRATNLDGEDIIFALFSQSLSLSRRFIQQQQVQKLLAEKGGSIGIDAFCPVMNYEGEERERERGEDGVDIERCGVQWQHRGP